VEGGPKHDKQYFYWLFEAQKNPEKAPLIMWLSGGPGCSSELALFAENGPCRIKRGGQSTTPNAYSWHAHANIVFVDQPAGTGFSTGKKADRDSTEGEVAEDLYHFMQELVRVHPRYHKNDFYVFGESYAGHYVPATAHRIYRGNRGKEGEYLALRGLGIGNGLTDPLIQYKYYPKMAYKSHTAPSVVSRKVYKQMKQAVPLCTQAIRNCQRHPEACGAAHNNCNVALIEPVQAAGKNIYNLNERCKHPPLCYSFSDMKTYLNSPRVRKVLGVTTPWKDCSTRVNFAFQADWLKNYAKMVPDLLHNGHTALIYAGDQDFICNWLGNKAWVKRLQWHGAADFQSAKDAPWMVDGKKAGRARHAQGLTFLQLHGAGHMVPMDQPKTSQAMVKQFLTHHTLLTESEVTPQSEEEEEGEEGEEEDEVSPTDEDEDEIPDKL
jgi:cathepsin A (carboxypeptidase C)